MDLQDLWQSLSAGTDRRPMVRVGSVLKAPDMLGRHCYDTVNNRSVVYA